MVTYRGLRNGNDELVEFDETKPTIFMDFDGVLNPLPYEKVWIGPETHGMYDPALWDRKNWRVDTLEPDLSKSYPITGEFTCPFDRFLDYADQGKHATEEQKAKRWRKIHANIMDDMLIELRRIIADYDLQLVYLTYWRREAMLRLEPKLQLGGIGYLDWFTHSDRGHKLKIDALMEFYEETNIRTPFVIFDDESTIHLSTEMDLWPTKRMTPERKAQHEELNTIPKLIFTQDPRWGIQRGELAELEKFAQSLKS